MSKKNKPTIRDIVLEKQISKAVINRSQNLDKFMREIIAERKKRKETGIPGEKESKLIKEALRIGRSPSESGVKTYPGFSTEPTQRLGKKGR